MFGRNRRALPTNGGHTSSAVSLVLRYFQEREAARKGKERRFSIANAETKSQTKGDLFQ